jgi:glycosyltransferase involved in cell wall biosynthesis
MRILYLGSFRLPNLDAAAPRVLNVAKALREAGHSVSFISWGGRYRESDLCTDGKYRVDGFEYIITNELDPQGGFVDKAKSKLTRGNKTKALLKQKVSDIDAIITYNGSLTRWLLKFTKKHNIKLINDITEWYSYNELKCTDWIPYAFNMFITQKRVKNKIVISSYLDRFYSTSHNIIIPATCDAFESKWQLNKEYAEQTAGSFDGVTLIYAGNPSRKDLLYVVINVVQRLITEGANLRFLILGITREKYMAQFTSLLHDSNLSDNIQFLGRVSQDLIPAFYSLSDFMVLLREPNRKSNAGFPTKFSESMMSGTPVIANLTSDLGKYLINGRTGFVVENNEEENLYQLLKEKVIFLSSEQIKALKTQVKDNNKAFDYHYYIEPLQKFSNELI